MPYLDTYRMMLERRGHTKRDRNINILKHDIGVHACENPAYKHVLVNGEDKFVVVNSKDDYTVKEIVTMPGERVPFGSIVQFGDMPWIVTKTDVDDEIYSKSEMYLCNCVLRWIDRDGIMHRYDGYAEDATKYSEGVESTQYLRIAEFQIKVKIRVDQISSTIYRDMRFVIDAEKYVPDLIAVNDRPFVFRVTRRNIVTGTYKDEGYVEITLVQDQWIEGKDDYEQMVAAQPYELKESYPEDTTPSGDNEGAWL